MRYHNKSLRVGLLHFYSHSFLHKFPAVPTILTFDLAILDVDLVAAQDDGHVLADADQISVPVGHVLVRHASSHVEHDDGALPLDVVAIAETLYVQK